MVLSPTSTSTLVRATTLGVDDAGTGSLDALGTYMSSSGTPGTSSSGSPAISGGWGDKQVTGSWPNYKVSGDLLPVGAVPTFYAIQPSGATFQTVTWSGGTIYKSYFSGAASDDAPATMAAQTQPASSTGTSYSFMVHPQEQAYTVTVKISYQGGTRPDDEGTITFQSERPKGLLKPYTGTTKFVHDAAAQEISLYYESQDTPGLDPLGGDNHRFRVQATTATKSFPGHFMFMQTADSERYWTDQGGVRWHDPNIGGGVDLDNGGAPPKSARDAIPGLRVHGSIGLASDGTEDRSWTIDSVNSPDVIKYFSDYIMVSEVDTSQKLSVGQYNQNGTAVKPERLNTYLMFKPRGPSGHGSSTWVALAKVSWGWGMEAKKVNGVWQASPPQAVPATVTNPIPSSASDFFPSWTGRVSDHMLRDENDNGDPDNDEDQWIRMP